MANYKGHKKTGGRAKGTPNKATAGMREVIARFTEENFEEVFLKQLEAITNPRDRCEVFLKLMRFCLPTLSSVEMEAKVEEVDFADELRRMSDED